MKNIRYIFGGNFRQLGMVIVLVGLTLLFQALTGGSTLSPINLINLMQGNAYVLILAVGMVLVIIAGHIDLSVGSVAAAVGIIVAVCATTLHMPWWAACIIGILSGVVIGAWQGFWVAYLAIPAFIVTLAGMLFFRGLNQLIGQSNSIPVPQEIVYLGAGYLPQIGPDFGYNNPTLILGLIGVVAIVWTQFRKRRRDTSLGLVVEPTWTMITRVVLLCAVVIVATLLFASGPIGTSIPVSTIILIVLVLIYSFIAKRTVLGRHIYAVGGNVAAAQLSGVRAKRVNFFVMLNMSVLSALAAILFIGRSTSSGPSDGTGWELDAIAAVFIGGAAVTGGVGTVIGAIVGGLVMAVLNNGLQLLSVGADLTSMIKGLVLLVAVLFDLFNKVQGRPSIIGNFMAGSKRNTAMSALTKEVEVSEEAEIALEQAEPTEKVN